MYKIILASESPRRREILNNAGFNFEVIPANISEFPDKNLNVDERILDIARRKSIAVLNQISALQKIDHIIIAADTEVVLNNQTLGKPENEKHAFEILRSLSNTVHEVKTAIVIQIPHQHKELSHIETSKVTFHNLTDEDIWTYIKTGEAMDKAGAYGIQGQAKNLIKKFEGSYDNVVGLPLDSLIELLIKGQINVERKIKTT